MKTISWNNTTYNCPFADVLPQLKPEERQALAEDIRQHGVLVAVVLDEEHNVLDGHNRLEIAAELLLTEIPVKVVPGLSHEQKRNLAENLNVHRRHLDLATVKRLKEERVARVAKARQEGKSLRFIAAEEAVSKTQVIQDLNMSGGQGCPPETEQSQDSSKVKGRDGKKYPTKRAPRKARQRAALQDAPSPDEAASPIIVDAEASPMVADLATLPFAKQQVGKQETVVSSESVPLGTPRNYWRSLSSHANAATTIGRSLSRLASARTIERNPEQVRLLIQRLRDLADRIEQEVQMEPVEDEPQRLEVHDAGMFDHLDYETQHE